MHARPPIGLAGLFGAIADAHSYVFFTSTVVYAIVHSTPDYSALTKTFGSWMIIHGALMCVGGITFGASMLRAAMDSNLSHGRRARRRCGA